MVRYAGFGGLFNEVWKMSFQGKKIQILVFYLPLGNSQVIHVLLVLFIYAKYGVVVADYQTVLFSV